MKYKATYGNKIIYYNSIEEIVDEYYTESNYDIFLNMTYGGFSVCDTFITGSEILKTLRPELYEKKFNTRKKDIVHYITGTIKESGLGFCSGVVIEEAK